MSEAVRIAVERYARAEHVGSPYPTVGLLRDLLEQCDGAPDETPVVFELVQPSGVRFHIRWEVRS